MTPHKFDTVEDYTIVCPECQGKGNTTRITKTFLFSKTQSVVSTCNVCKGPGKIRQELRRTHYIVHVTPDKAETVTDMTPSITDRMSLKKEVKQ